MSIELWVMFALAYLATTLTPGPNVLLVLKNAVQYGWRTTFVTVAGNLSCQLIIVSLVALGVGELLSKMPLWFLVMKVLGGAYLIYLGVKALRQKQQGLPTIERTSRGARKSNLQLFRQSFLVSASNPKTMIFLSAFLPQFLDVTHPHSEQFAVMFGTIAVTVMSVHLAYVWLVTQVGQKVSRGHFEHIMAKVSGSLFITMGGGVLLSSRP
ncbi:LysE family translocator [Vibrio sp. Vb2880]|uniref:LysE family translocator n=1 Tax=Vibrio TaxID=662 RepID=UPI0013021AA5|nr:MULTISPECIES: LysE family translocator [Vibrio]MBO0213653.1 LysE family translocator [Vibrio sp. Vb2880]